MATFFIKHRRGILMNPLFHFDGSEHPCFSHPSSDSRLWRYLSLAKLLSLLETRCLYFARSDRLGDPFEGSWARHQPTRDLMASITKEKPEIGEARRRIQWRIARESTAVNCWHLGESESAAMWNQYSKQGLALQTTFAALVTSLPRKAGDEVGSRPIFVGKVRYVDYESTTIPEDNAYWPFMHKRLSFAHEQEVRAVILCHGDQMQEYREADATFLEPGLHDEGVHVPVDLASLIGCIYVSPTSPAWFADVVRSVLARFGMNVQVEHSALDAPPIH